MGRLQTAHALYRGGRLIFSSPEVAPRDGVEVVVTYVDEPAEERRAAEDPILALRGRGKGEGLVEKLLRSRREDRERE